MIGYLIKSVGCANTIEGKKGEILKVRTQVQPFAAILQVIATHFDNFAQNDAISMCSLINYLLLFINFDVRTAQTTQATVLGGVEGA